MKHVSRGEAVKVHNGVSEYGRDDLEFQPVVN